MSTTYTLNVPGVSWATGRTLVARFRDGVTAATVLDLPLSEPAPQEYFGNGTATTSATTFTVEVRDCATADSAGFDASTTIVRDPETYVPPSSTISGTGGGSVLGQTTFRLGIYNSGGTKFDPTGLTGVTMPNGVVVRGTSTVVVAANTAMTRTGTGTWTGPTITDAASGLLYEWTARLTFADGSAIDDDRVTEGSTAGTATTLTTRALIEDSIGKVNLDAWLDVDSDGNAATMQAQADRLATRAQNAAFASADNARALDLWPLSTGDPQYSELVDAATEHAVGGAMKLKPEAVKPEQIQAGEAKQKAARERMDEIWQSILLRADTATASAPVAEPVTYYPPGCGYSRLTTCGPICG